VDDETHRPSLILRLRGRHVRSISSIRKVWWTPARCIAVLGGLVGAGLLVLAFTLARSETPSVGIADSEASPDQPVTARAAPSHRDRRVGRGPTGTEDLITGRVLPQALPTSVSIPTLHIASRLVRLGLDDYGAMEVPSDPASAGWYERGPTPGALGPAVIAGHVTWNQAPAVFFRLASMHDGDLVEVGREDGRVAVFRVTRVARYDKHHFPTRAVFGRVDHAGLRLITCGGDFDELRRRYHDNVVVFARLASAHRGTR
jgi:hypothetical protein